MAIRYTTNTINPKPNIARIAVKFGESSATNTAGTAVTIAKIVAPIQSSIGFPPQRVLLNHGSISRFDSC
jgi:hypothetical protein